jgi:ATPase family associated with various cellular activities (AAA)
MAAEPTTIARPPFIEGLSRAYSRRGKGVVLLTGDIHDLFWNAKAARFLQLEQCIYQELSREFLVLRVDAASGIDFYDRADREELMRLCALADLTASKGQALGNVAQMIESNRHETLPTLVLLRAIGDALHRVRLAEKTKERPDARNSKPLCVVFQYAGSLFPPGDFDRLSEIDRQRLVYFLDWIQSPLFQQTAHLCLLVSDTKSDANARIFSLPIVQHVEIDLPDAADRARFVEDFVRRNASARIDGGVKTFVEDTAGLRLTNLQDLLESSLSLDEPVTRKTVLAEVNAVLGAELGDIIRISIPDHGPDDVIGSENTREIFESVFRRCESPETAVSAVLVSGPNGGGKTYQLEAHAAASGRIVVELAGLRGMYYGQTDRFFELLRWHIRTYGKILILIDEAHTAFGSVHKSDTHETERRLGGNIIKMMGDRKMLGKVVWGLMTSRPDELDPDVKSRSPIQIPIFDPEGDERVRFVRELFKRNKIEITDAELIDVVARTESYSARDLDYLVREVRATKLSVPKVLENWQASNAIRLQRRLQTLIAALHCSYPKLLPKWLREAAPEAIQAEIDALKVTLRY